MYTYPDLPPLPDIEPDVYEDWWYEAGRYSWQASGRPEAIPSIEIPFQMILIQVEDEQRVNVERDAFLLDLARKQFVRGWKDRLPYPRSAWPIG